MKRVFLLIALLWWFGCSEKQEEPLKATETAVEKAYDATTGALRNVVEDVNDAVYD